MSNAVDKKELSRVIKKIMEHLAYDSYFDDDDWIGIEQIVALIGASKEVTEEWIEEKAREAWNLWWYKASGKYTADLIGTIRFDFQGVKNLIRSLIEEINK